MTRERVLRRRIRVLLAVFLVGLVLSGLTAFPLEWELGVLRRALGVDPMLSPDAYSGLQH